MSQSPHVVRGARRGFHFGQNVAFEDSLWTALTDSYGNTPMAITAENLAKKYGVTRDECDDLRLESQAARARGAIERLFRRRDRARRRSRPERLDNDGRKG